jgi:uncharacterized protein (TIGR03546 family)
MEMFSELVAPLRRVVRALLAFHSPHELAAGFTLGMIIGLVPKGNLIALSLCVLLFSLRVNKGMAVAAAVLFSCLWASLDPFAHKLGLALLSLPALQVNFAAVYNMPLGPWVGFHNTVTSGALLVGLYVAYPVYFVTRVTIEKLFVARTTLVDDLPRPSNDAQGRGTHAIVDPPTRNAA